MKYVNDSFYRLINEEAENRELVQEMKKEVDEFLPFFSDSPDRLSRWGHYYFCDDDGGRLIFDLNSPHKHRCEVCGKVFEDEVLDGVWVYFYRNKAVIMALVSAFIYKATKEKKYFDYSVSVMEFYARHYKEFPLHNKENLTGDSYDTMPWGCGRMMPQGLNESIVAIRFVQAIEILRDELSQEFLDLMYHNMFREMYSLLALQATRIHNISCWNLSAIGVMGLAFQDQEMIDFAFSSEYNIRKQLETGVTKDYFWYEGSIHYNFFLLEGVAYLFLFSRIYDYDFGKTGAEILQNMFVQAYNYAFGNHFLPNPNDGWPNLNLRTFSYIYHTVARAMGEDSPVANLLKNMEASDSVRTALPLSEPYYCNNRVCLEQLLFNIDFDYGRFTPVKQKSHNFPKSNYVILRNNTWNGFMKYGLNGKSHAHPDIMNVELMCGNHRISRDLSNAGYRARLCNEWHRKTLSHNTVCWNGKDITSVSPGECLYYDENKVTATAREVYEGIHYTRTIEITEDSFLDDFRVESEKDGVFDYVFHLESDLCLEHDLELEDGDLEFKENGYQHVLETKRVKTKENQAVLHVRAEDAAWSIWIDLAENHQLYLLKTMDNPVNQRRNTILLRSAETSPHYHLKIMLETKQ
ncbi:heparinase II/III family protein [Lacrimispora sp.]|uniref:heparinase II/III domain-containing protein n=1 Tax=Lacrimispora sp. TaxID=2719234 RepID=UPI0034606AA7